MSNKNDQIFKKFNEDFNQIFVVSFLQKLQLKGCDFRFWHTPNGGSRNKAEASKLKMMGVLPGVFDLTLLTYKKLYFIEMKVLDGTTSKQQEGFFCDIKRYGFDGAIVYADSPRQSLPIIGGIMHQQFGYVRSTISSSADEVLNSTFLCGLEKS